jgi:hypothetical protein
VDTVNKPLQYITVETEGAVTTVALTRENLGNAINEDML